MDVILTATAGALGAIIGSFLNVVIHRFPRGESVVFPGSHCPSCNAPIAWYDNIPVVSWIVLGARCRACRSAITPRYPLVELANGLFYVAVYQRTGPAVGFLFIAAFVSITIALIFIDADVQLLPDAMTLPGIALGIAAAAISTGASAPDLLLATSLLESAAGALTGAALLAAIILLYWLVRRIEGMGWGDVKMLAMIGAFMGIEALVAVLLLASFAGSAVGIPLAMRSERGMQVALPFGIFLGLASLAALFFGRPLLAAWARLLIG